MMCSRITCKHFSIKYWTKVTFSRLLTCRDKRFIFKCQKHQKHKRVLRKNLQPPPIPSWTYQPMIFISFGNPQQTSSNLPVNPHRDLQIPPINPWKSFGNPQQTSKNLPVNSHQDLPSLQHPLKLLTKPLVNPHQYPEKILSPHQTLQRNPKERNSSSQQFKGVIEIYEKTLNFE